MTTPPIVPNFNPATNPAHIATDRYDFEKHIEGLEFRHTAKQIDLFPTLVVDSTVVTTVQEALTAIVNSIDPPFIADATHVTKGILKLNGDINGTADSVTVVGLQTHPVSNLTPNDGEVLTWNSGLATWKPSPAVNAFSPAGDLAGNNVLQSVLGWTGLQTSVPVGKVVRASNNVVNFITSATPLITQDNHTSNHASNLTIRAQSATTNLKNGGYTIIAGGASGPSGFRGGVKLQLTNSLPAGYPATAIAPLTFTNMVQLSEPILNRRVLTLCNPNDLTTIDMPANTGDMVMYIRDATIPPSSGSPSNGTILYSNGGQLWVKQQDGNQFSVGSVPNPSVWGNSGQQTYTSRNYLTSSIGSAALAFTFNLPDFTGTKVDVILVGKQLGVNNSAQFNLSMGYTRSGGAPAAVGVLTNADPRTTAGASGWSIPNIAVSGNTLQVFTGYSSVLINWLVITQLTMSQGA